MDAGTSLMAFRQFVSRRGKPFELLSDCGTHFRAGKAELQNAFQAMEPDLKQQLCTYTSESPIQSSICPTFWWKLGTWNKPNMLLMGRPDSSLPQVIYSSERLGRRKWRHSQISANHFWAAFIRHYLSNLQTRQKWKSDKESLDSGQWLMTRRPSGIMVQTPLTVPPTL